MIGWPDAAALPSIGNIGERLGSAPSMVYNYFTNKREILLATIDEALAQVAAVLRDITQEALPETGSEFETMAHRLGDVMADLLGEDRRLGRLLIAVATSTDPEIRGRWVAFAEPALLIVQQFLTDGRENGLVQPEIDPALTARAILALPIGVLASDQNFQPDRREARLLVQTTIDMVTHGIIRA